MLSIELSLTSFDSLFNVIFATIVFINTILLFVHEPAVWGDYHTLGTIIVSLIIYTYVTRSGRIQDFVDSIKIEILLYLAFIMSELYIYIHVQVC